MPVESPGSNLDLKNRLRRAYDAGAAARDEAGEDEWRDPLRSRLVALLAEEEKTRVLEIGAGTGHTSLYFADQGLDITATDLSAEQVDLCRAKGLTAHVRDFYDLGFPARSFDAVWAMNCLLHVPSAHMQTVLAGIREVLDLGGTLHMGTWGGLSSEGIFEKDSYDPPRFFSLRTDDELQGLVSRVFEVEELTTVDAASNVDDRLHMQFLIARRR